MIPDDWRTIQSKECDLDQMLKRTDHQHKQKVMDSFVNKGLVTCDLQFFISFLDSQDSSVDLFKF